MIEGSVPFGRFFDVQKFVAYYSAYYGGLRVQNFGGAIHLFCILRCGKWRKIKFISNVVYHLADIAYNQQKNSYL